MSGLPSHPLTRAGGDEALPAEKSESIASAPDATPSHCQFAPIAPAPKQ
jgi:hypothetical protein